MEPVNRSKICGSFGQTENTAFDGATTIGKQGAVDAAIAGIKRHVRTSHYGCIGLDLTNKVYQNPLHGARTDKRGTQTCSKNPATVDAKSGKEAVVSSEENSQDDGGYDYECLESFAGKQNSYVKWRPTVLVVMLLKDFNCSVYLLLTNGLIYVEDEIREDAAHVVQTLTGEGINVYLLSGDKKSLAEYVASVVGIPKNQLYKMLPVVWPNALRLLPHDTDYNDRSLLPSGT
ncbi:copper-transporting ATPase PAA1, chloroplastic [Tanacetum coccineum]